METPEPSHQTYTTEHQPQINGGIQPILSETRARVNQKLLKNPGLLKTIIQLMMRHLTVNKQELKDKCTPEEWFNIYSTGTLKQIDDTFVKASEIVSKYLLNVQRNNRWKWMIQFAKADVKLYNFFDDLFKRNGIVPSVFAKTVFKWMTCVDNKINTLYFHGPPNTCKTLIARMLTNVFLCGNMNLKGVTSDFYYEPLLDKSIGVLEELWVMKNVVDDFKSILGGIVMDINKKHNTMQKLRRTPIIVTSNHETLGRGFLNPIDECALQNRCYKFKFDHVVIPPDNVSCEAFFDWLLINYEN